MALGEALINAAAYELNEGKALINGAAYAVNEGKTLVEATSYALTGGPKTVTLTISGSFDSKLCVKDAAGAAMSPGTYELESGSTVTLHRDYGNGDYGGLSINGYTVIGASVKFDFTYELHCDAVITGSITSEDDGDNASFSLTESEGDRAYLGVYWETLNSSGSTSYATVKTGGRTYRGSMSNPYQGTVVTIEKGSEVQLSCSGSSSGKSSSSISVNGRTVKNGAGSYSISPEYAAACMLRVYSSYGRVNASYT